MSVNHVYQKQLQKCRPCNWIKSHTHWRVGFLPFKLLSFFGSFIDEGLGSQFSDLVTFDLIVILAYELDIDIFPIELHAKIQVCILWQKKVKG